jgi:DNA-binding XRE family transcriptional regulator
MSKGRSRLRVLRASLEPARSQREIANTAGMTRLRYWAIEKGETVPTRAEREAIAKALAAKVTDIAWPESAREKAS